MRGADVEDDADPRRGQLRQIADVADGPGAHLQHEVPGRGVGAQRGERQADLVVERAGRPHRGADPLQQLGDQVLGAGLAGRSGERDERGVEALRDGPGERAEGRDDVVDHDRRHGAPDPAGGQHGHRAGLDGALGEVVAVHVLTGEGGEEPARPHVAGVDHDRSGDPLLRVRQVAGLPADDGGDLGEGQVDHRDSPPAVRESFRGEGCTRMAVCHPWLVRCLGAASMASRRT